MYILYSVLCQIMKILYIYALQDFSIANKPRSFLFVLFVHAHQNMIYSSQQS